MAELKTKPTSQPAEEFLNTIEPEQKRKDVFELLKMHKKATGEKPRMWGTSIVGFGMYHYKSERSSQEGDWPLAGFSPRKQSLTVYITFAFDGCAELLKKLGKHKVSGGSCLYINKLADVDTKVLEEIIKKSYLHSKKVLTPSSK
jgi:hypothetical protein